MTPDSEFMGLIIILKQLLDVFFWLWFLTSSVFCYLAFFFLFLILVQLFCRVFLPFFQFRLAIFQGLYGPFCPQTCGQKKKNIYASDVGLLYRRELHTYLNNLPHQLIVQRVHIEHGFCTFSAKTRGCSSSQKPAPITGVFFFR